jgi:hypothetical protein
LKKAGLSGQGKQETKAFRQHDIIFRLIAFVCTAMFLTYYHSADLFLFCPLSRKENIFFLCERCVLSEACGNVLLTHLPA